MCASVNIGPWRRQGIRRRLAPSTCGSTPRRICPSSTESEARNASTSRPPSLRDHTEFHGDGGGERDVASSAVRPSIQVRDQTAQLSPSTRVPIGARREPGGPRMGDLVQDREPS